MKDGQSPNLNLRKQCRQELDSLWNKKESNSSKIAKIKNDLLEIESNKSRKFYRYRSFVDWKEDRFDSEITDIKNKQITLVHPIHFNDPYDCRIPAHMILSHLRTDRANPYKFKKKIKEFAKSDSYMSNLPRWKRTEMINKIFDQQKLRTGMSDAEKLSEDLKKVFRAACFSINPNDMYFWSHYGGLHKGYCIEYEFGDKAFEALHPVDYVTEMPNFELKSNKHSIALLKSIDWSRENEWRLVSLSGADEPDYDIPIKKYSFHDLKISAVYLGLDFYKKSDDVMELRKSKLLECLDKENIFKMKLEDNGFRIIPEKLEKSTSRHL